jgi:hypothetical protein
VRRAKVALLSTGGLRGEADAPWARWDEGFRVIPHGARDVRLGLWSPNFDRSGWFCDPNVIFPRVPLEALVQDGFIGGVAPRHISFMGASRGDLAHLREVAAPAAAAVLREDGVDVAVLLPVCPSCTVVVAIVADILEAAGIATVTLSLVRKHVEDLRPPRALHCNFPFGRPLGLPCDAVMQGDTLKRLLSLLELPAGPILEDHPDAIPDGRGVALRMPAPDFGAASHSPSDELLALSQALGSAGASLAGDRSTLLAALAGFGRIVGGTPWAEADLPAHPTDAASAVRSFYEFAAVRLCPGVPPARATESWFYEHSEAGKSILKAQRAMSRGGVPRDDWFYLSPYAHSLYCPTIG